jgi:phosphoribosyl 1,2-cyclic phosphate phosphodiesterase
MLKDMSDENTFEFKLLGTGTSTGVPTISCNCSTCISEDPKDKRLRCSALITYKNKNIIIDTGPDFRQQFLNYGINHLDAVVYTHHHFDHIGGFDDIRGINFTSKKGLPIYLNYKTLDNLSRIFSYAFRDYNETGGGIPMVDVNMISEGDFYVEGLKITILPLIHGTLEVLGFRIGNIAYCTDTNHIPDSTVEQMQGLDVLILDGLRPKLHKTHFNIDQAIEQAKKINAKQTYITHIAHQVKHSEVEITLPEGINLAYDGLTIKGKLL